MRSSEYGRILFDWRGFVLYGFTADKKRRSVCFGACAAAWPPYLVKGGAGRQEVPARNDSPPRRQAPGHVRGRPLYYYVGDRRPGQILRQDVFEFGGDWLVVRPNGAFVR